MCFRQKNVANRSYVYGGYTWRGSFGCRNSDEVIGIYNESTHHSSSVTFVSWPPKTIIANNIAPLIRPKPAPNIRSIFADRDNLNTFDNTLAVSIPSIMTLIKLDTKPAHSCPFGSFIHIAKKLPT